MSTFENKRHPGACPCGKGEIVLHAAVQDSTWTPAKSLGDINCPKCSAEWIIVGKELVSIESQRSYVLACTEQIAWHEALNAFTATLMDGYFQGFAPESIAPFSDDGLSDGMYQGFYEEFLRDKKGQIAVHIAHSSQNAIFLKRLATDAGRLEALNHLLDAFHQASVAADDAFKAIVRRKLPDVDEVRRRAS